MTFDWWDNAPEETQDIARSGGGVAAMVGAAFLAGLIALKRLAERSRADSHRWVRLVTGPPQLNVLASIFLLALSHPFISMDTSPPLPLRI
ncbi:MAG: hypothetical protein ACRD3T_16555 [Terriglobia bacterium]